MKNRKLQRRLDLLNETRQKISRMKVANVFTLDVNALNLLQRLSDELQDMLSENLGLQKKLKVQTLAEIAKKKFSSKDS